jgi:hypothetical protein
MPTASSAPALTEAIGAIPAFGGGAGGRTLSVHRAAHADAADIHIRIDPADSPRARNRGSGGHEVRRPRRTQSNKAKRKETRPPHDVLADHR